MVSADKSKQVIQNGNLNKMLLEAVTFSKQLLAEVTAEGVGLVGEDLLVVVLLVEVVVVAAAAVVVVEAGGLDVKGGHPGLVPATVGCLQVRWS